MEVQVQVKGKQAILRLPSISDLTVAADLRQRLIEQSEEHRHLVIDAQDVERITTPCIQVLLSADRTFAGRQEPLSLSNPSQATRSAFAELGMQSLFEKWLKSPP
jgi:chemotaxis protein CheX